MPKNTLHNHHKKHSAGYHVQTVVVVLITLVMFFPLYWMIATSLKSAEEAQLIIPTMYPHELHPENYLNVLTRANFSKYYLNTIMDEDKVEDIYLYFKEDAETDSLDAAIEELGSEYSEEEIRLVRIKFISEVAN